MCDMSSSGVTTVSGWCSFMCIMAYFFTSSVPNGETIVQPHGQVPTAPMQVVSTAVYLSLETRINCSAADSHSIATMSSFPKSRHLESFSVSHHSGDLHSDCLSWKFGFRFTSKLQVRGVGFEHQFTSKIYSDQVRASGTKTAT